MRAFRDRDQRLAGIEELYRARFPYFVQVARAIVGDRERALEAVQEGFANAIRGRASFRGEGSLEAWVWRAVVNAARKATRRPLVEVGEETEEAYEAPPRLFEASPLVAAPRDCGGVGGRGRDGVGVAGDRARGDPQGVEGGRGQWLTSMR